MNIISFDEVKRGDTVKFLDGPMTGQTVFVDSLRFYERHGQTLKFLQFAISREPDAKLFNIDGHCEYDLIERVAQ